MDLSLSELLQKLEHRLNTSEDLKQTVEQYYHYFLNHSLLKNATLQDAFRISSKEMELLYNHAYTLYQNNEFEEASSAFRWLVLLNPFANHSWMGLGASLQLLKQCEEALKCYAITSILDIKSVLPFLYASECHLALGQNEEAIFALEQGIERSEDKCWINEMKIKLEQLKKELYV